MELSLQQLKEIATKLNFTDYHHNIGAAKLQEKLIAECEEQGTTLEEVATDLGFINLSQNDSESSENENIGSGASVAEALELVNSNPNTTTQTDVLPISHGNTMPTTPEAAKAMLNVAEMNNLEFLKNLTFADASKAKAKETEKARTRDAMKLIRCTVTCNNKNKTSYQGEIFTAGNAKIHQVEKFVPFGVKTHIPQILYNVIKEKKCQMFKHEKVNGMPTTKTFMINEYNIELHDPITKKELEAIARKQMAEGYGEGE